MAHDRVEAAARETKAAANIMDVMMGGDRSWRTHIDNADTLGSTFLESADWAQAMAYARAALAAADAVAGDGAGVPEGWKLVPVELTDEMIEAWVDAPSPSYGTLKEYIYQSARSDWATMLRAAPDPKEG